MKNASLLTLSCLFTALLAPAASNGEEFLLYTPKPATGDQVPSSPAKGVLVRKVTVQPGDTLSYLSRKHIGVASWFPQLLLFNTIKNPDRIYPGEKLLVPVRPGHGQAVKKSAHAGKGKRRHAARKASASRNLAAVQHNAGVRYKAEVPNKAEVQPVGSAEQDSFLRAKQAYLAGDYRKAQDLFAGFLQKFPRSRLIPDASLYQADCFMRLSAE